MNAIADIFRAGGAKPSELPEASALVADLERQIRSPLPGAFRQLLSLANGEELLGRFSGCDDPIPFSELGQRLAASVRWGFYDPIEHRILPFMRETQGVCTWAIPLDQGDDPPVLIEVDSDGTPEWDKLADSFSIWLECQVWDFGGIMQELAFAAQAPGLDDAGLALLRRNFEEGRTTYAWPGDYNYRFSNARSQVLLWSQHGACDWFISPRPGASWKEVLDELSGISSLVNALYGQDDEHEAFLRKWRARAASD
jgi:hypothetical protein